MEQPHDQPHPQARHGDAGNPRAPRLAYADAEGVWSYEPDRSFEDDERDGAALAWIAAHRFDLTAALRLARRLAPTLTVRGRSVADVLAEGAQR
jgi:hypothetical protein